MKVKKKYIFNRGKKNPIDYFSKIYPKKAVFCYNRARIKRTNFEETKRKALLKE